MVTIESVRQNVKEGWRLNPNEKVVERIIERCNANGGECPCHNDGEEKECPCSNYRLHDHCCCNLYQKVGQGED